MVIAVFHAVLGDENRQVGIGLGHPFEALEQAFGDVGDKVRGAEVGILGITGRHEKFPTIAQVEPDGADRVVIQAKVILRAFGLRNGKFANDGFHDASGNARWKGQIEVVVTEVPHEPVEGGPRAFGNHRAELKSVTDARFALEFVDGAISNSMPAQHIRHDLHSHLDTLVTGREISHHVPQQSIDIRFVDGAPGSAVFLECIHGFAHELLE